ncbi:hypothetical protein P167DRAFT_579135 [Morchella conica CCBAS932]|uniref:Uncharacterized protein n=1 Tax=Morchella conica CCBAS932 TaxID=1392247 RepID=A0A3N4KGN2_9PEZI|nr:hypothetical protein P167DRAFT_579135 [Morchella conica CCBAS932]
MSVPRLRHPRQESLEHILNFTIDLNSPPSSPSEVEEASFIYHQTKSATGPLVSLRDIQDQYQPILPIPLTSEGSKLVVLVAFAPRGGGQAFSRNMPAAQAQRMITITTTNQVPARSFTSSLQRSTNTLIPHLPNLPFRDRPQATYSRPTLPSPPLPVAGRQQMHHQPPARARVRPRQEAPLAPPDLITTIRAP